MFVRRLLVIMLLLALWPATCPARVAAVIPEPLQPWTDWVLYDQEERRFCTPRFADAETLQCDWPSALTLTVTAEQGDFSQQWLVQHERWLQLPGSIENWPQEVKVDDSPALVVSRNDVPQIKVGKGTHTVTGRFAWTRIPEFISVPAHTGIVRAEVNGKPLEFPKLDDEGRLWLQAVAREEEKIENRLALQNFRLLDDQIPFKETVHLLLDVAGSAREIVLGPVLAMDTVVPVSLHSALPARLEPDGRLRIQVRPGQWDLTFTMRHIGPVAARRFTRPMDGFWPEEEIWSFSSQPDLRVVEIEGVPPIDPLQTSLPENWRGYPAYRVRGGETMRFKEIKRGDPVPAPDQLSLQRNIWLRFDGSGYTIQETITGTKNTDWRLEMNPPTRLGRVAVDGVEQFITRRDNSDKTGVELRRGMLNLTADSLSEAGRTRLPATGWDHDFQQVGARLFLPPGWRLINATGADTVSNTWVKRWTLLDFFIVLIFTVAVARLFNKPLAVLAFAALVLMYHEQNAPRWIWLAILLGIALLRYLPQGRFRTSIKVLQLVNVLLLVGIAIPFSIQQLREGIYPQLEKPWQSMLSLPAPQQSVPVPAAAPQTAPPEEAMLEKSDSRGMVMMEMEGKVLDSLAGRAKGGMSMASRAPKAPVSEVAQYDPSMVNQTGPGLPSWQWNSFSLTWSGPVQRDQTVQFLLTGPTTNLVLAVLRVVLMILLLLGLFGIRFRKGEGLVLPKWPLALMLPLFLALPASPLQSFAGEIPSPELFQELQQRLLAPDDCFPRCADIASMELRITPEQLRISMRVLAQTAVALPLPGNVLHWLPGEVRIDDQPAAGLFRTDNELWLHLPAGEHQVVLTGRIPRQNSLQLPLPLRPHLVSATVEGWSVEGIRENGVPDSQLQFKRLVAEEEPKNQILETGILPPFLHIERTLRLGLSWQIETTVTRLSPAGAAVVFSYPLLPGESVVTEGVKVQDNQAQLNMDARQTSLQWESVLARTEAITLSHPETTLWTEEWRVDVSPIFHVETEGIPVILHQQGSRWYPTWHPWPGEEVRLTVTRPAGVEGQTITIDKSHLETRPGQRATETSLQLSVRSSQGAQHSITLPDTAQLQEVTINGQVQPIRQEGRQVPLPIRPGLQEIRLQWHEPAGIASWHRTPAVDLGLASVNSHIDLHLPQNRWPLFVGGPLMGPAVLFWSTVIILLLVSFALARSGRTPLKFHQWFLLGIGMSQSNIGAGLLVAGWLIAIDLRGRVRPDLDRTTFNLMQAGLGLLTLLALGSLVAAISMGLLGHPDMNIVGNGSNSETLRWYQDHNAEVLPVAWVLSIPMLVYRLAMLAWALWISFSLLNFLKLGWKNFSIPVIWHKIPRKTKPAKDSSETAQTGHGQDGQK
ncbi:MAG: hypothetical protein ACYC9M_00135 [Desulfobulbaceae bacterium]